MTVHELYHRSCNFYLRKNRQAMSSNLPPDRQRVINKYYRRDSTEQSHTISSASLVL